jgi:3',5'-cyclic AMP phosphodiesterase CpdA
MTGDYLSSSLTGPSDIAKSEVLLRFVQISDTHLFQGTVADKLKKYLESDSLPAAVRADLELVTQAPSGLTTINRVIEHINQIPVKLDFVLHTGDVGFDPETSEEYAPIKQIFAQLTAPAYYLPGNHDTSQFLQTYFSHLGQTQSTFDYEIPNREVQIVCIDSSVGFLTDDQLVWLEARIAGDDSRPLVIALHHNLISYGERLGDMVLLRNHTQVRRILQKAKHRLRGVFYGHMHVLLDVVEDGITYYCCPTTWTHMDIYPYADVSKTWDNTKMVGFNLVTITTSQTLVRRILFPFA